MDLLTVAKPYLNSDMLRVERAGFRLLCLIPAATVRVTSHITAGAWRCPQTSLATSSQFLMLLGSKKALYWGIFARRLDSLCSRAACRRPDRWLPYRRRGRRGAAYQAWPGLLILSTTVRAAPQHKSQAPLSSLRCPDLTTLGGNVPAGSTYAASHSVSGTPLAKVRRSQFSPSRGVSWKSRWNTSL